MKIVENMKRQKVEMPLNIPGFSFLPSGRLSYKSLGMKSLR
jgi:hypothetical protein